MPEDPQFRIRISDGEIDFEGTARGLRTASEKIMAFASSSETELTLCCTPVQDPAPYELACTRLAIAKEPHKIRIRRGADTLKLSGSLTVIRNFAKNLEVMSKAIDGTHAHYDWHSFADYIEQDAPEMTISKITEIPSGGYGHDA